MLKFENMINKSSCENMAVGMILANLEKVNYKNYIEKDTKYISTLKKLM